MERRKYKRKTRRLEIYYRHETTEFRGVSSNFSNKGLFIRTTKPFKEGISVHMRLDLGYDKEILLSGIVRRSLRTRFAGMKDGMGIELTDIPKEYNDFLAELYKE